MFTQQIIRQEIALNGNYGSFPISFIACSQLKDLISCTVTDYSRIDIMLEWSQSETHVGLIGSKKGRRVDLK